MLSLLVIHHALGPVVSDGLARTRLPANQGGSRSIEAYSRPYLRIAGAQPLRFHAESPPLDLAGKPAAGAPPHSALSPASIESASQPARIDSAIEPVSKPIEPPPTQPSAVPTITTPTISILPDDTRPSTRAEDFLPFFQFPGGNGGNITVAVPAAGRQPAAPNPQPPSSATYQQR